MEDSILKTIRQMIGPSASYDVFDTDLIIHINSAFSVLCELGVGPKKPFKIVDQYDSWDDFAKAASTWNENVDTADLVDKVKQYIYLKAKMIFDPPASATVVNAYKEQIDMLEWRLREVSRFGY